MTTRKRERRCDVLDTGLNYEVETCLTWRGRPAKIDLSNAEKVAAFLYSAYPVGSWDREKFIACVVNSVLYPLALIVLFEGAAGESMVDPAYAFRRVLQIPTAAGVFFAHNHPSGTTQPSLADMQLADRMEFAGKSLKIRVLDHLILTPEGNWSAMRESMSGTWRAP